jgi:hypothetical protein
LSVWFHQCKEIQISFLVDMEMFPAFLTEVTCEE